MPKIKVTKEIEIVNSTWNVNYHEIPQRKMIVLGIEMHEDGKISYSTPLDRIPTGSIVKVVQRYRAGDEDRANQVLDTALQNLKSVARHTRTPDRIIISEKRKSEISLSDLSPMQALEAWFEHRPPRNIDSDAIKNLLRDMLSEVAGKTRPKTTPAEIFVKEFAVKNFMPFKGSFSLPSIPEGLIGVVGKYSGQDDRSNRAGKSAFFDAFLWNVFGEGRKLQLQSKNIFDGEDSMEVAINISANQDTFRIVRSMKNDGTQSLSVRGLGMQVKKGNEEIENWIGLSRDDFVRTCFVRQGDLESILNRSSTRLKEDIIRWRNLEVWGEMEKKAKDLLSALEKDISSAESSLDILRETTSKGRPNREQIDSAREKLKEATDKNATISTAKEKFRFLKSQMKQVLQVENASLVVSKKGEASDRLSKVKSEYDRVIAEQRNLYAIFSQDSSEVLKVKEQVSKGFNGVCPVDDKTCPRTVEINSDREEVLKRLKTAEEKRTKSKQEYDISNDSLKKVQKEKSEAESELTRISEAQKQIDGYDGPTKSKIEEELQLLELDMMEEPNVSKWQDQLTAILAEEKAYVRAKESENVIREKLSGIIEKAKIYRYFRFACGTHGIPYMLIEEALEEISGQVNLILEELGTDHRLKFDAERELKRSSRTCEFCGYVFPESEKIKTCLECQADRGKEKTDELRPMIIEGDRKQDFEQDSGAGRGLVALATRIAMSRFLGARILFLDEVSGMLDAYHLAMLVKLLHRLPQMGFRQVFVISHQKEVDEAMPNQIAVVRIQEEGRSEIC